MVLPWKENTGKFFRRSIVVVFLLFLLVVTITLLFFIATNTRKTNESIRSLESAEIEKTAINISDSLDEVAEMSSYLSTMETYIESLFLPDTDYASYLIVTNQMKSYLSLFDQINNISIKTPKGQEFTINGDFPDIDLENHKVGKLKNADICVVPQRDVYSTIFFDFSKGDTSHAKNDVSISVNSITLGQENLSYTNDKKEYLLDKNGNIIAAYDMSEIGMSLPSLYSLKNLDFSENQKEFKAGKDTYLLTVKKVENIDMYVVAVTNRNHYATYYNSSIGLTALISVIILLVTIIVAFVLLQFFYQPIKNILKQIGQYQEITISKNVNEVEYISKKFDQMYQSNLVLDETATKALKDLKMWNTAALQAQICPHFLHNSLDAINWLAFRDLGKNNEISKATRHMAYIMGLSMDITRMFCTIAEEIDITKRYIEIVDIRSDNKFSIIWQVDEKCLDCTIPRLCIQPLIENAVTHAFPDSSSENVISITIREKGDNIEICVEDNGTGISAYNLNKLRSNIKSQNYSNRNVGLRNINQRCKIIFGDEYGIIIRSVVDKGSKFTLKIPKDK